MIRLIDLVECDDLERSVVKMEAFRKALLVQDAGRKDDLFALVLLDETRAVLVAQGKMNLSATSGGPFNKLQAFRVGLDKSGARTRELRFCAAGTYASVASADAFDPKCFVQPTFPEIVERFAGWRAGRANW
jgi:hypothetical protein